MPRKRKRPEARPIVEDTDDLFTLLLEQAVPSTPEQWFVVPWTDGRNAFALGLKLICSIEHSEDTNKFITKIENLSKTKEMTSIYWEAQELKVEVLHSNEVKISEHLFYILEMIQKWASHSDGGGHVYNGILLRLCNKYINNGSDIATIEPTVRRWRSRDAIRISSDIDGEPQDIVIQRRLRAFESAWQRGLFKVAYCV